MKINKLLTILNSLNRKEWHQLTVHLNASFNPTSIEILIFDYIRKKKIYKQSTVDIKQLHQNLAPSRALKTFRNAYYNLGTIVERFLLQEFLTRSQQSHLYNYLISKTYADRGLYQIAKSEIEKTRKALLQSQIHDLDQALLNLQSHHLYYFSLIPKNDAEKKESLRQLIYQQDLLNKQLQLYYDCEAANRSTIKNEYWSTSSHSESNTFIELFESLQEMHNSDEPGTAYQQAKNLYLDVEDQLSLEISRYVLLHLLNKAMYFVKRGHSQFGKEMTKLYDHGLSNGILLNNNKLSENRFLNILDIFSKLEEVSWAQKFRDTWIDKVVTNHFEALQQVAQGYLDFGSRNFQRVIKSTRPISDINLSLRSRWLILCSTYEVYENDEPTYHKISSFQSYLTRHRHKIGKPLLQGSKNLIKTIQLLLSGTSKEEIQDYITKVDHIIFKSWIESKIK